MLWDIVFDFFIKYIFGGISTTGDVFPGLVGLTAGYEGEWENLEASTSGLLIKANFIGVDYDIGYWDSVTYMPLGNYLSLIATIITMVAILLFCVFIVKKIIAIIFRLFTGSSAF